MRLADYEFQAFDEQRHSLDVWRLRILECDPKIELILAQQRFHLFLRHLPDAQGDGRIAAAVLLYRRSDQVGRECRRHRQAQRPALQVTGVVNRPLTGVEILQCTSSVRKLQFPLNRLKARLVAQRVQERIGFQLN
jgi:hypothetical protein